MKKFNITNYNKACAEFLGYKYFGWNNPNRDNSISKTGYWAKPHAHVKVTNTYLRNPLKFHSDWNHIMEVVKKIKDLIGLKSVDECTEREWYVTTGITRLTITTPKAVVVLAIWEFLNWYKENKQ